LSGHQFAQGRTQTENIKEVLSNILTEGNEKAILPGYFEAEAAKRSEAAGGLLFSDAELEELNEIAIELGRESLPVIKTV